MKLIEEWRPVVGYEGHYEVSNMGNVRSVDKDIVTSSGIRRRLKGKQLKPDTTHGYYYVSLWKQGAVAKRHKRLHRLVAESWLPNGHSNETVNHKNGIKTDNRVENLEWSTHAENRAHAKNSGLWKCFHEGHHHAKMTADDVVTIKSMRADGCSQKLIAERFGISQQHVSDIVNNRKWVGVV